MRQTTASERETILAFFRTLKAHGIHYCILRNYEDVPEQIGHDLDVFVSRESAKQANTFLIREAMQNGLVLCHVHRRDYFTALFFCHGETGPVLHIDIYHGALTWHGLPFLDESNFIDSLIDYKQFVIPAPQDEALTLAVISMIWGGFFKTRYSSTIQTLLSNPKAFDMAHKNFASLLGPEDGKSLLDSILSEKQVDGYYWGKALRKAVYRENFKQHPLLSALRTIRHWAAESRCIASPPGIFVAVDSSSENDFKNALGWSTNMFGDVMHLTRTEMNSLPLVSHIKKLLFIRKALGSNILVTEYRNSTDAPQRSRFRSALKKLIIGCADYTFRSSDLHVKGQLDKSICLLLSKKKPLNKHNRLIQPFFPK